MSEDFAARLLDAQVEHMKRELLTDDAFRALVSEEVDNVLAAARELTLAEVVTSQMIKDTAYKFAVRMRLEGSIPELAGEVASRLYRHPVNDEVKLSEVVGPDRFDDLVASVIELDVTRRVIREILESPMTAEVCAEFVTTAFGSTALGSTTSENADSHRDAIGAVVRERLTRAAAPILPALESAVDGVARRAAGFVLRSAAPAGDDAVLMLARRLWRAHATDSMSGVRAIVTADDVEDAVVIAFEFWKSFRQTDYFRVLLDEGIEQVFDKYGSTSPAEILVDLGIGRDDLIEEGLRFGRPVLAELDDRGILDAALRRRLAPFYRSAEFRAAFDSGTATVE